MADVRERLTRLGPVRAAALLLLPLALVLGVWSFTSVPSRADVPDDALAALPSDPPTTQPMRRLNVTVVGDSFTGGSQYGGFASKSWAVVLGKQARRPSLDVRSSIHPASGYVTRGFDVRTFGEAVGEDVRADDDVVVLFGSVNDGSQDPALVGAATRRAVKLAKQRAPQALVVVIGIPQAADGAQGLAVGIRDVQKAAAAAEGAVFVDPIAEGWFSGANAKYVGGDGVHPTDAGHREMAALFEKDLGPRLKAIASRPRGSVADADRSDLDVTADRPHSRSVVRTTGRQLVRTLRGSCSAKVTPQIEVSENGGEQFGVLASPVSEVLSVITQSDDLSVVGLDASCRGPYRFTFTGGAWRQTAVGDTWFLTTDAIHGPRGTKRLSICSRPISLSVLSQSWVRVGCSDGSLLGTLDGGASWSRLGHLDDLRAVSYSSPSEAVALAPYLGCGAQSFHSDDGGRSWTPMACLDGRRAEGIATASGRWYAMVSNTMYVSKDVGATWNPTALSPEEIEARLKG